MSRPVTISDDVILESARALFTAKGPRATTAEIAQRAGVSEGSLFKRFGSKAALHRAAMTSGIPTEWMRAAMHAQAPLRTQADFERFILWQANVLREVVPVVLMAWSSRSQQDELPVELAGKSPPPLVAMRCLEELLQAEMDTGHLRARNAEVVARTMLGSVWHFVFMGMVLRKGSSTLDEATFVRDLARIIFSDVGLPQEPQKSRKRRKL